RGCWDRASSGASSGSPTPVPGSRDGPVHVDTELLAVGTVGGLEVAARPPDGEQDVLPGDQGVDQLLDVLRADGLAAPGTPADPGQGGLRLAALLLVPGRGLVQGVVKGHTVEGPGPLGLE